MEKETGTVCLPEIQLKPGQVTGDSEINSQIISHKRTPLRAMTFKTALALQRPLARFGRLFFHTSRAYCFPRKRPGTRNPLPEEEIKKRVEEIMYRTRKKPKPKDHIDYNFEKVGNYRVKDEQIQKLYKEYLRLYHPAVKQHYYRGPKTNSSRQESTGLLS